MTQVPSSQSINLTQMEINGGNPILPPELITSILVRLPVKSLIRFQCVCKEWQNLLKTQSFITEHLQHSTHQNPFLFFEDFSIRYPQRACLLNRDMQVLDVHIDPFINSIRNARAISSCNGLICLGLSDRPGRISLSLWNPATRELRQVSQAVDYGMDEDFHVGFGFSSIVNDYKIVRIREYWKYGQVTQVEVYSLNMGTWKEIEFGNLDGIAVDSNGLAFNGAIFWFGSKLAVSKDEHNIGIIVSFDVATEVFTLIPMPPLPSSIPKMAYRKRFSVHENKLAMLSHTLTEDLKSSLIHLWVMEEGTSASKERWCWTKKYTSSPYTGIRTAFLDPMTIWRNEIVCNVGHLARPVEQIEDQDEGEGEPNGRRKIVMFNFTTNEFGTFEFDICKFVVGCGIFNYAESLVQVGNIHIE